MKYQHQQLVHGGWEKLNFFEQMANVGSEVIRGISWKSKKNDLFSRKAIVRALELLDLTIYSQQKYRKLKELTRLRELLVDYFYGQNQYSSTTILWHKYFYSFNYAAIMFRAKKA
jgi:hypothetical protein